MLNPISCYDLLVKVNALMRENGIEYFISNGTLLGIWRSGDFFEHDNDIDIGVIASTWKDDTFELLLNNGFSPLLQFGEKDNGLEYSFMYEGTKLDIFFYYEAEKYFWHAAWDKYPGCGQKRQMLFHTYDKFVAQDYLFKGVTIRIPAEPERCLEQAYGQDWHIPNKNWKWNRDPRNMTRKDVFIEYKDLRNLPSHGV